MTQLNQSLDASWIRVMNAVAAGQTNQTSSAIDTAGYDGVEIVSAFGAITAGAATSVKVQQSSDDGSTDAYADLASSSVTVADTDDNKIVIHDIYRPRDRYLKVIISRATQNAVIDGIFARRYAPRVNPATNDSSTVVSRKLLASPAEGTA